MEETLWELSRLYQVWREAPALDVVFQPLVHIPSGQAFGFEALSRPRLDERPVPIGLLLESAAGTGSLSTFDEIALPAIFRAAERLRFPSHLRLFVNVSPLTLLNPDLLFQALASVDLKPEQMVIEISERESIPESLPLVELLAPFRRVGMAVALDDFGAGYSGLNRLVGLDPDFAKIDLNLVRNIDQSTVKYALVESTVRFARQAGHLEILAEGIETPAELVTLHELGVALGQGFLLGKPAPHLVVVPHQIPLAKKTRRAPDAQAQLQAFLTTSHRLVDGIAAGEGMASHMVHLTARLLGADHVILWTPTSDGLEFRYAWPKEPPTERIPFDMGHPVYQALVDRHTKILQSPSDLSPGAEGHGMQSMMIIPVVDHQKSRAVLSVGFSTPLHIRPEDIAVAEGVARLMALTWVSDESPREDVPAFGEPLFEAISTLVAQGDLDPLLAKVMEAALSVSGGHLGYIGILTDEALHCVTADEESFDFDREDLFDPTTDDGRGPVGQVLQRQASMVIQDIDIEPTLDPWRKEMLEDGIQAALGIPLLSSGRVLGILKVYHSRKNGFEPARVRRLEALASLATTIIEKWQETHAEARQAIRDKSQRVIALLPELIKSPSGAAGHRAVQNTLLELMEGDQTGVLRPDADGQLAAVDGALPRRRATAITRVAKEAMAKKCVVFDASPAGVAAIPLLIGGQAIGAIWVTGQPDAMRKAETLSHSLTPHLLLLSLAGSVACLMEDGRLL
ncbi:EAL domain-containing protein [Sulfobacillus harzensis]|uniref:EAL domain-containing protein n=1 Tax=Sulfobacillus harzensis TaxID=2729629 RepID=A0A7Y0L3I1_9FIRM|nr:EAL domain-containing protein [Sulfobacillus harzensis]NMP21219.1 EAL domain-containing protein [Sulfobacillus harzensis]